MRTRRHRGQVGGASVFSSALPGQLSLLSAPLDRDCDAIAFCAYSVLLLFAVPHFYSFAHAISAFLCVWSSDI